VRLSIFSLLLILISCTNETYPSLEEFVYGGAKPFKIEKDNNEYRDGAIQNIRLTLDNLPKSYDDFKDWEHGWAMACFGPEKWDRGYKEGGGRFHDFVTKHNNKSQSFYRYLAGLKNKLK